MKIIQLFSALILTATIISCKNNDKEDKTEVPQAAPIPQAPQPAQPVNTVPAATTPTPVSNNPAPATTTPATTVVQPATATAATGLNPKHGMPGHRCDIPEGAPLNSKPSSNIVPPPQATQNAVNVTKTQSVSIPQPTPVTTTAAPTGPGLNPEHGKPGHRCDIAVGAPLNSAPAAKQ